MVFIGNVHLKQQSFSYGLGHQVRTAHLLLRVRVMKAHFRRLLWL